MVYGIPYTIIGSLYNGIYLYKTAVRVSSQTDTVQRVIKKVDKSKVFWTWYPW